MPKSVRKGIKKGKKGRETISIEELRQQSPKIAAVIDGLVSDPELKARGFVIKAIYPPSRT